MRIAKRFKVELCASDDDDRKRLAQPYLDTKHECLAATNGHMLVVAPVELCDNDRSGPISCTALRFARNQRTDIVDPDISMVATGKALNLKDGTSFPRADTEFPPYREVIPDKDRPNTRKVAFNAQYLWELCQAMGGADDPHVIITIGAEPRDPILVERDDTEAIGVLMPRTDHLQ